MNGRVASERSLLRGGNRPDESRAMIEPSAEIRDVEGNACTGPRRWRG